MALSNKVEQFNANSDLIDQFVNGDANTTVQTAGGPVPSLAKLAADSLPALEAKANKAGDAAIDFSARAFKTGGVNLITMAGGAVAGAAPQLTASGIGADINIEIAPKGGGRTAFRNAAGLHMYIGGYSAAQVMANFLRIYGGPTGANPTVYGEGSDLNVGIDFTAKGAGEFIYRSSGGIQFAIGNNASTVNYVRAVGGAAGQSPNLNAQGSDTDINIAIQPKGIGSVFLQPNGRISFAARATVNSVNYLEAVPNITGQAAILRAAGSDGSVGISVQTKGSGQVFVNAPINLLSGPGSSTERRLAFSTTVGNNYFYARDSDGVLGMYDVPGAVSPWYYTPGTKTLTLGAGGAMAVTSTPGQEDNSTRIPTTAWVNTKLAAQGGGWVKLVDLDIPVGSALASVDYPTIFADNPGYVDYVIRIDGLSCNNSGTSAIPVIRVMVAGTTISTNGYYQSGTAHGSGSAFNYLNIGSSCFALSGELVLRNIRSSAQGQAQGSFGQLKASATFSYRGIYVDSPLATGSTSLCKAATAEGAFNRNVNTLPIDGIGFGFNGGPTINCGRIRIFGVKPA